MLFILTSASAVPLDISSICTSQTRSQQKYDSVVVKKSTKMIPCKWRNLDCIHVLAALGADVKRPDKKGFTPLHQVSSSDNCVVLNGQIGRIPAPSELRTGCIVFAGFMIIIWFVYAPILLMHLIASLQCTVARVLGLEGMPSWLGKSLSGADWQAAINGHSNCIKALARLHASMEEMTQEVSQPETIHSCNYTISDSCLTLLAGENPVGFG